MEDADAAGTTPSLEELIAELDALLDAWFLGEVTPALDEAHRARAERSDRAA
ncbi:MAG TPA: hypothetical protein VFP65_06675 [Anaeromyxobacteraceae bacterium]|nr:hypothetical protein [Anaeromyxobacteraceae bacterium]